MKSLICLVIAGLCVGVAPVHADQGRGNANFKVARPADKRASDVDVVVRAGIVWAPTTEVQIGKKARVASVMGAEVRIGSRARIGIEPESETE